jgi:uncharacterized ferredoxin-like protein
MTTVLWIVGLAVVLVAIAFGLWYWNLILSVKKEIGAAPRVPMFTCDIHGIFPANGVVKISVPAEGQVPLEVDMCIFCYDDKMKKAEKIFKT